jgi:bacterial leucyl aminopeptidase
VGVAQSKLGSTVVIHYTDFISQNGQNFMDITESLGLGSFTATQMKKEPKFPAKPILQKELAPLIKELSKDNMKENLEKFTSFHTRYYKSDYGKQSSEWLLKKVQSIIEDAGADKHGVYAEHFKHPWGQNSVIATIPGANNSTVVVGAHQDSINLFLPSIFSAPGADDDGSGTVTILEAFRVLLTSKDVIKGKGQNTVEFHWYSAEEGGLLGSQAIFSEYEKTGRDIKAMLQQDMTGFVQGTLDAGKEESVGVITDFVNPALTEFIKEIVTEVCFSGHTTGFTANLSPSTALSRTLKQNVDMLAPIMHRPQRQDTLQPLLSNLILQTRTSIFTLLMIPSST